MNIKKDTIFSTQQTTSPFTFNESVAEVFPDMIKRSVPGYQQILQNINLFAKKYVTSNSLCFDLGCSLGAASLAMSSGIEAAELQQVKIIAIDNSNAMLERCQQHINAFKHQTEIILKNKDIQHVNIENASMVVVNFTLQFIAKEQRQAMINNIYQGLNKGGILVLSEKIHLEAEITNDLLIELHHQFKKDNGYSDLEVSQKRNALENVLLTDSLETHYSRLKNAGFSSYCCWLQQYNFVSLIAIK